MEKSQNHRPFGKRDVLGYMFGDIGGSFVSLTFDAYYLIFTTYVLGINVGFMSGLFLFSRLYDAIDDPFIGSLPDRFSLSNSSKFKPWIKIFMWPLALSILLGFSNINSFNLSDTIKHIWVVTCYMLYGISYTGTSMPFGAMANAIATNQKEREKLSAARAIGGLLIAFVIMGIVPILIWDKNNNPNVSGYTLVSILCAMGCIISYTLLNKMTVERKKLVSEKKVNKDYDFFKTIKEALSNRALVGIMIASIGSMIWITGNNQFVAFIFKEYYKAPRLQTIATVAQVPVTLLAFVSSSKLSDIYGKRKVLTRALLINLSLSLILFFQPIANPIHFIIINSIANIGQSFFMIYIWAFVGDAIDYHEFKYKTRNDGTIYSTYTFSRKVGTTIASASATAVLAAIGFISGQSSQSVEVSNSIRYLATSIPIIASLIELVGIRIIYHLSREDSRKISQRLLLRAN